MFQSPLWQVAIPDIQGLRLVALGIKRSRERERERERGCVTVASSTLGTLDFCYRAEREREGGSERGSLGDEIVGEEREREWRCGKVAKEIS